MCYLYSEILMTQTNPQHFFQTDTFPKSCYFLLFLIKRSSSFRQCCFSGTFFIENKYGLKVLIAPYNHE